MVVLTNPQLEEISLVRTQKPIPFCSSIPVVDLSAPGSASAIIAACEDPGFLKLTGHGIPVELMARLESEAIKFFSLAAIEKERSGPANPFGYGSKTIGPNGDVGWVEYLLFEITANPTSQTSMAFLKDPSASSFRSALDEYISAVRNLAARVLEMMAEGLDLEPRDVFSRMVMDEGSDSVFRLNHYPPCPVPQLRGSNCSLTGFGEHTDPQIITILRSNNSTGFQIALKEGAWVGVPPDPCSFFINVGDSLQVLTNGRLRSVRHRVMANGLKSRVSMIYFGGPPPAETIAPLAQVMAEGEQSRYEKFTWMEYKRAAYKSRLADNRLGQFERSKVVGGL